MIIQFSAEAESDILDGMEFYDQRGLEVGEYFRESILFDIATLSILGGVHARRYGFHCMPAKRFPFAIYYDIIGDVVAVFAVIDERRSPTWIKKQLKKREPPSN